MYCLTLQALPGVARPKLRKIINIFQMKQYFSYFTVIERLIRCNLYMMQVAQKSRLTFSLQVYFISVVDLFQTYIQQEIVPQEADSDIKRDVILRELRNSGRIETVELMENYSSVERTSSSLKKSVQKKTMFNYEGDSVVTVSHVKLDDEMFFNNGASTLSNDNSILQSEQVAEDTESKAVVSPTIRVACDGNISCYEEVKLGVDPVQRR